MTQEQKTQILKALKPHSAVTYIGADIVDSDFKTVIIPKGTKGIKIRNARADSRHAKANTMLVSLNGGQRWYLAFERLTCPAIEMYNRLTDTKTTDK